MKESTIARTARALKVAVENDRTVSWQYNRWQHWTHDEIADVADRAGICYGCKGISEPLNWFEYP